MEVEGRRRRTRGSRRKTKSGGKNSNNINSGKILVHAFAVVKESEERGYPTVSGKFDNAKHLSYGILSTVDLKTGQVEQVTPVETTPPLFDELGDATMLALGDSTIYFIGSDEFFKKKKKYVHKGASYFDLAKPQNGWNVHSTPLLRRHCTNPNCVTLDGKIYAFNHVNGFPFGEVFDPKVSSWRFLKTYPITDDGDFRVSVPAIADPLNSRILVRFLKEGEGGLVYAYHPAQDKWECLFRDFRFWGKLALLLDGVLYFHVDEHQEMIFAFDLANEEWLKVVLTSDFKWGLHMDRYFAFLHLGDGVLGLVTYNCDECGSNGKAETFIILVKFRVQRATTNPQELLVTPLSVDKYYLNSISQVVSALTL